jgi:hypothetical protein
VPFKLKQHTVMGVAKKFYRVQTWLWSLYQWPEDGYLKILGQS